MSQFQGSVACKRDLSFTFLQTGLEVKNVLCSTKLCRKFILLINVKMPTIVGILTIISRINTSSERFKAKDYLTFLF